MKAVGGGRKFYLKGGFAVVKVMERDDSHTTAVDVGVAVVAGPLVVRLAEQAKRNEEKLSLFFERRDARESESERGTEREERRERERERESKKRG